MRTPTFLMLLACSLATPALTAAAGTITVMGDAVTMVSADRVVWKLSVTTKDTKLEQATAQADGLLAQAVAIGATLGLAKEQMRIGRVAVAMRYESKGGESSRKFSHYEISQQLKFIEEDLSRYDEFREALMGVPGLQVNQEFFATGAGSATDDMMIEALRSARRKAEALAAVVGARVGRAVSISEFKPNPMDHDIDAVSYQRGVVLRNTEPDGIEVKGRIYAVFELE